MKKTFVNTAVAVLVLLGLNACSSGGGNNLKDAGISNTATEDTQKVSVNNTETDSGSQYTSNKLIDLDNGDDSSNNTTDNDNGGNGESDNKESSVVIKPVSSYFIKEGTETYTYLNDDSKKAELQSQIENGAGSCLESWKAACYNSSQEKGNVLFTAKQSYTGYAVVREDAEAYTDNEGKERNLPRNTYIALVKTPTTDINAVVDATYKGTALYTSKNMNSLTGYTEKTGYITDLTLTVKDSEISGDLKFTTGTKPTLATFNSTKIVTTNDGQVGFSGSAEFTKSIGVTEGTTGTYQGLFGGTNAEEVVGTFESNTTEVADSVQGAFIGTRQ